MIKRFLSADNSNYALSAVLLGFYLVIINGCSSADFRQPVPDRLVLVEPSEGPSATLLKQKVTWITENGQQQFLTVTRIDSERLDVVVVLATGQKVLSMNYDGTSYNQIQHLPQDMPGREMMALVQFVLWPEASIRQNYRPSAGWILEFGERHRTLLTNDGIFLKVDYNIGSTLVVNYQDNYRIVIDLIEVRDI